MPDRSLTSLLHFIRRLAESPALEAVPDRQLVKRFVRDRDEAAFTSIVQRHGPMVLGVCCRIVGDGHCAEDCFQATFLILVRKAASLRHPERLSNWLHGVARRTALSAAAKATRSLDNRITDTSSGSEPLDALMQSDLRRVLDDELRRLPNKYRAPIILHHLEGRPTQEVADTLGWPQGTVMTRLARGRERLRSRLSRRGVTLSVALLTSQTLSAAVPAVLLESTVRVAMLTTAGGIVGGAVSAEVAALVQGVMKAMFWTKCTMAAGLFAAIGSVGVGAGWFAQSARVHEAIAVQPVESGLVNRQEPVSEGFELPAFDEKRVHSLLEASRTTQRIKDLTTRRHAAAVVDTTSRLQEYLTGRGTYEFLLASADRLGRIEYELCSSRNDRIAALENRFKLIRKIFDVTDERFKAGLIGLGMLKAVELHVLDAELELEKEKMTLKDLQKREGN